MLMDWKKKTGNEIGLAKFPLVINKSKELVMFIALLRIKE